MSTEDFEFMTFVTKYGKSYTTMDEFNLRLANFKKTDAAIKLINAAQNTHIAAHNKMSDWTHEEYQKLLGMKHTAWPNLADLPEHVVNGVPANDIDWRNSGMVSHVKDQGGCGSCWAFSTTGSIESARAIAGWGMYTFSEQQLVDCSWGNGNMGCGGGWYYWAWSYMQSNPLQFDWDYPYFSGQTGNSGNCNYNRGIGYANTTG